MNEHALLCNDNLHNTADLRKPPIPQVDAPLRSREFLSAVERVMFRRQFVLIDADNSSPARVDTLEEARAAIAAGTVPTAAGRLADGLLGSDIDADDPVIGDACAEALIAWCDKHRLPHLLRESGRPGGRHVIAVVMNEQVPVKEWARLCRDLSRRYRVVVQDRTGQAMRLVTAPHRIGLPSPVIACTLTPAAVMDAIRVRRTAIRGKGRKTSSGRSRASTATVQADSTRSGHEYGLTCAMVRHGWSPQQIWEELRGQGGKAAERGQEWFRRYMLMNAVTTVAAEDQASEAEAWARAVRACPKIQAYGRDWWRYWWRRALAEAATTRPRRRKLPTTGGQVGELPLETARELKATRRGLLAAVDTCLPDIDPRHRRSLHAGLYALAYALVIRDGSMSVRAISESARLDTKTVRTVLRTAQETGLLVIRHHYAGGASDCTAYGLGPAALAIVTSEITTAPEDYSPTTCTTPAPHGAACPTRLRRQHRADRRSWRLRCDVLAELAPGERLATSRHPVAKLLRSLWYQRQWWHSLTSEQQEQRRDQRRAMLGTLSRSRRSEWFDWLADREEIVAAADRLTGSTADAGDTGLLLAAPVTIHRGLRAPHWSADRARSSQLAA
ncbi:hypothetical protein [Nocardia otitidiscaviarum]|uniref:hypothetical protein n=1 Tax=Nocardia otitidiscaviarum TaxID=1823 RepID=UPI002455991C|nr:hypothetical protein [Nocardia otitidiscaviarum]